MLILLYMCYHSRTILNLLKGENMKISKVVFCLVLANALFAGGGEFIYPKK